MKGSDPAALQSGSRPADKSGDASKARGIRFSDPEWEEIKEAAERPNMSVTEFVRVKVLEVTRGRDAAGSRPASTDLAPMIERAFRYPVGSRVHGDDREGFLGGVWTLSDANGATLERECWRNGRWIGADRLGLQFPAHFFAD